MRHYHRAMEVPGDPAERAETMRRRAADWAAGALEAKALDRKLAREQNVDERLADGVELMRIAERLRLSTQSRSVE